MNKARAEDMAGSRGLSWGCQNEAKSIKIHGADKPCNWAQGTGKKGWEHDIWIFLHASTSNVMIQARADDMAGPGVVQGGAKMRQNQWKCMVLNRHKIRIGEWVKIEGIIIYGHFCMQRHLKWWLRPEQMIWRGPGVVHGGAKMRQNQLKRHGAK